MECIMKGSKERLPRKDTKLLCWLSCRSSGVVPDEIRYCRRQQEIDRVKV